MPSNGFFSKSNNSNGFNDIKQESEAIVIPVIEEFVSIGKEVIESGKITVTKSVKETTEDINISLLSDEYVIEHVAINQYIDDEAPKARQEGDTFILPVLKEVIVKQLLLVEEVRITKRTTERNELQSITLRKESVAIARSTPGMK